MKIFRIYLLLSVNFVAAVVAYYRKCYDSISVCLIANTNDDSYNNLNSRFTLNRWSATYWCKDHSSSLAIITNETVQSAIEDFIKDRSAKLVNSYVFTNGYRYDLSNWEWINGRKKAILPRVNYNISRYGYLVVSSNRSYNKLSDGFAYWKKKFICSYVTHNASCSSGFRHMGSRCYKIHEREATWYDARNICLKEQSDLATFEDGISSLTSVWIEQYWVGLQKEKWNWFKDQTKHEEMKYSNWEGSYPPSTGDCLCLKAWTGKWTNCDCSQRYRYICIQDYASDSTSTVTTQRTGLTTETPKANTTTPNMTTTTQTSTITTTQITTTKIPTTTKQITTTTKPKTTRSTTTTTPKFVDSTSQLHSTPIHTLDDDFRNKMSEDSAVTVQTGKNSGFLPIIIGIGIACLFIIIVAIVVVVFMKNRRSRSDYRKPSNENPPPLMAPYKDDAPSTVYAAVIPNTSDPVYSASELNSNQTVYAELDLEPKRNISPTQRTSNPGRFTSEQTPSQAVYAEVNQVPHADMNGRPEGSSEYDNIQMVMDSVYANSAQTRV